MGSINLSEFVKPDKTFDFDDFANTVSIAVIALNDVLDEGLPLHPLQEQRDSVRDWRQIGLGIMGLADMLIRMGVRYGSKESIDICDMIGHKMAYKAIETSSELALATSPYPKFDYDAVSKSAYFSKHTCGDLKANIAIHGLRNSQLLTIAPTGTLSTMLGISGGIEPIYANYYTRKTESLYGHDEYYKVYTPIVKSYMEEHGLSDDSQLPEYFVTAQNLNYRERINMQAIWQSHIDASISSTVNVPNSFTVKETEDLYMYAWEKGLKGVTIFRDGCKRTGILSKDDKVTDKANNDDEHKEANTSPMSTTTTPNQSQSQSQSQLQPLSRPIGSALPRGMIIKADDNCIGKKRTLRTGCGTLHCEAFFDPSDGQLLETYFSKGSTGGCVDADTEYFNGRKWKKISEYKRGSGEHVLQYNPKDATAELVQPYNYIVNDNVPTLQRFTTPVRGLDMVVSYDHRMFLYTDYTRFSSRSKEKYGTETITVADFLLRNDKDKIRHVPASFSLEMDGIPLTDNFIRLLIPFYVNGVFDGPVIHVSLLAQRKKQRFEMLLGLCNIGYEKQVINIISGYTEYTFFPSPKYKEWFAYKGLKEKWYDCTNRQLQILVAEYIYWDGSLTGNHGVGELYTRCKEDADFLQFALVRLGFRATIGWCKRKGKKPYYFIRWTNHIAYTLENITVKDYPTVDGRSYCFTVPSGYLVLRRNDSIFITGNCNNFMIGLSRTISLAARGGVDIYSIADQLKSSGTCPSYAVRTATKHDTSKGSCCPVAIGYALIDMYEELQDELFCGEGEDEDESGADEDKRWGWFPKTLDDDFVSTSTPKTSGNNTAIIEEAIGNDIGSNMRCPQCGGQLVFEGGCNTCKECGWSKCD